ncbi:hypothetical protein ACF0H5_001989 [Mactra antiquata]
MEQQIEGRDYFYDRAKGKNISCPDKCDIPTQYPHLCYTKCPDYEPKLRVTTTLAPENTTVFEQVTLQQVILIVLGVCLAIAIIFALVYIFRQKVNRFVRRIRELLCERIANPVPETNQYISAPTSEDRSYGLIIEPETTV